MVKYSLERAADPSIRSPVAETYLGDIVGVQEKLAGRASEVAGVVVLDERTVQITIDAPKAYFLAKLAYPTAYVVDKENVASGSDWTSRPNGTGPFKLVEWRRGERIVLERNPDYHLGPPNLNRVMYLLAGGSSLTMYENDEIGIVSVGVSNLARILDPANPLSREAVIAPRLLTYYLGFNATLAPFNDPRVRRAFVLAADREKILMEVYQNTFERAKGILPPGMPGYNPELEGLSYDPEGAKGLLAEAGYPKGANLPPITLTTPTSGALFQALKEMWQTNLGVDVTIQTVEFATFITEVRARKHQMFYLGWSADYPDPQDFLDVLFGAHFEVNRRLHYVTPASDPA
ncbi:MAG: hypothetical protein HYY02_05875 [Chloroflexi bacterium]|nr:hypothetical protein [Chloroflexota bacterium]